jgi:hypothetical protein
LPTNAREKFGDLSDVGKLAFAGKKKLPEEVDAQREQQRQLQNVSAGYERLVSSAGNIT